MKRSPQKLFDMVIDIFKNNQVTLIPFYVHTQNK